MNYLILLPMSITLNSPNVRNPWKIPLKIFPVNNNRISPKPDFLNNNSCIIQIYLLSILLKGSKRLYHQLLALKQCLTSVQ